MKIIRVGQTKQINLDINRIDFNSAESSLDSLITGVQGVIDAANDIESTGLSLDLTQLVSEALLSGNTTALENLKQETMHLRDSQTRMMGTGLMPTIRQ